MANEVEAYEPGVEMVAYDNTPPSNLFGEYDPQEIVLRATEVSNALAGVITVKHLYQEIRGRKHVNVEGWTLLGSMLGVFPVVEWTRQTEDGWEARVIAQTRSGDTVGAAEAMCSRSENRWKNADDYAIRSMAQTRATSKAMRLPLGFVMTLAGYDATPEEEMVTPVVPTTQPLTNETLLELTRALPKAEFHDPERWSLDSVLATANRVFARDIGRIADLSEDEAQRILEGARALIEKAEAERVSEETQAQFGEGEEMHNAS